MGYPYQFQLSPTQAALTYVVRYGLAWPDSWTFRPWSVVEQRADGSRVGFGFPIASWSWDNLGQASLQRILGWFDANTDASKEMYVRTYADYGAQITPVTYTALMHRPVDGEGKQLHARVRANVAAYSGVTLNFTRLEAV
jgi:hypothetical protein